MLRFFKKNLQMGVHVVPSYLQMHISISTIQPMLNRWVDPLGVDDPSLELRL